MIIVHVLLIIKNDIIILINKQLMFNYIGAHISRDSTIIKTIDNIILNNGNSLQIFVSSPMNSKLPNKENFKDSEKIKKYINDNNFKLVVHGSYVINLANSKINKRHVDIQDRWWIKLLIEELNISEYINSIGVVIHVGKYTTLTKSDGIDNMLKSIKYIINYLKTNKFNTKLIIENPAGVGTELLTTPNEFIEFYNKFNKDEKKYLGICLDTAHIWSSGYELNEYYSYFKNNYDDILVIHLNNSKVEKGKNLDRHETLFRGNISIDIIKLFLNNLKKNPIIILETPSELYNDEIKWVKKKIDL